MIGRLIDLKNLSKFAVIVSAKENALEVAPRY